MKLSMALRPEVHLEFQCVKKIREVSLNHDILNFIELAHASFQKGRASNPRGPFERSLLHYAAMGNCTELLRLLLQTGAPVDDCDQNKRTPLSWAAEYGALDAVMLLVESGAKVNSIDDTLTSPLAWSLLAGMGQIVETRSFLRQKGARQRWILRRMIRVLVSWK